MIIVEDVYNYYLWTTTFADSRTKDWLLVRSPLPIICFIFFYVVIVWIGPKIMKHMQPFKLKGPLLIYNFVITLLNLYIFVRTLRASLKLNYSYVCQPYVDSTDLYELQIADAGWWYFFSKLLEFWDTFFFILRKKDRQLSVLHVYHHTTMLLYSWIGVKWVPGGLSFLPVLINSGIHVLMYAYYGLSALGPQVTKYLWWKKYLTVLQLIQFTYGMVLAYYNLIVGCGFPLWMQYNTIFYMTSFIILFGKFYVTAYIDKRNKKKLPKFDIGCGQETIEENKNLQLNKESLPRSKYMKHSNDSEISRTNKKSN